MRCPQVQQVSNSSLVGSTDCNVGKIAVKGLAGLFDEFLLLPP